jgi:UDP-2,3-diacylglucosamine hydrolase
VIIPELVRGIALPHIAEGADIVVIGHFHEPSHLRLKKAEFVIIGDWITNFTYAVLEEGKISLRAFHPGGAAPEIIAPEISAES